MKDINPETSSTLGLFLCVDLDISKTRTQITSSVHKARECLSSDLALSVI